MKSHRWCFSVIMPVNVNYVNEDGKLNMDIPFMTEETYGLFPMSRLWCCDCRQWLTDIWGEPCDAPADNLISDELWRRIHGKGSTLGNRFYPYQP